MGNIYEILRKNHKNKNENFDPYKTIKEESNEMVLSYYDTFKKDINNSENPLLNACKKAAFGNIIDFGVFNHDEINFEEEVEKAKHKDFRQEETENFRMLAQKGKELLYIGDNAGEIIFDKLFIEEIKKEFPHLKIRFAVRSLPVLNDITKKDADFAGISELAEVIESGSGIPGTSIKRTTKVFKNAFDTADVIISKGQGNYETLSGLAHSKLFFLLMIKCEIIAKHIGYPKGSLLFKRLVDEAE